MSVREWFFAGFVVLVLWSLADSIWRLWRRRPAKYGPVWGEVLMLVVVVFVTLNDSSWRPRDLAAKAFVVVAFTASTVLRLIARKRFAVESSLS